MSSEKGYILLIDDSIDIRELVSLLYQSEGYHLEVAVDGKDALERLRAAEVLPSVILLDLMMPGMDGFAFRVEQEKDARLASVPVLIMTADANAEAKAKKIGANGYLRKPVAVDTLIAVAEKFCLPA